MNVKIKTAQETSVLNAFGQADKLREEALLSLQKAEQFYLDVLKKYPDQCEYHMAHERGRIEAMAWQAHQLRSTNMVYFSQAGQDRFLDNLIFKGKRKGTFVEIGGFDGVMGSNCLFFEAFRGWKGIMIEPSPQQMEHAKLIRSCECIEAAIAATEGQTEFVNVTNGYTQMSGLKNTFLAPELNQIRSHPLHKEETLRVPAYRLDNVLKARKIKDIDYISLDVEGAEQSILESFPFEDFNVTAWSIENNRQTTAIGELMVQKGYRFMTVIGVDEIYLKQQD